MNMSIDLGTIVQIIAIIVNVVIACIMYKSVKEIMKDRICKFLEKRIEEFYMPLIKFFGHGNLRRDRDAHEGVEEIIVSKRYLCGKKVAEKLPQHFTAVIVSSGEPYFLFSDGSEKKRWEEIADTIWNEYIEVLKEYYKLTGIKNYVLPEKPKWMFNVGGKTLLRE
jgi:hypothetical protein